jgi:hypothetical protein
MKKTCPETKIGAKVVKSYQLSAISYQFLVDIIMKNRLEKSKMLLKGLTKAFSGCIFAEKFQRIWQKKSRKPTSPSQ